MPEHVTSASMEAGGLRSGGARGDLAEDVGASAALLGTIRTGVRLAGEGGTSSPEVLRAIVEAYAVPREDVSTVRASEKGWASSWASLCRMKRNKEADRLAAQLDPDALSAALEELFFDQGIAEALAALGRFGNDGAVRRIVESVPVWDDWRSGGVDGRKDIGIARGALLLNDSEEAMRYCDSIGLLDKYASLRGTTADELRDMRLSDFGFDREGRRVFDLGAGTVTASISDDLGIVLFDDRGGVVVESLPERGADPARLKVARAELEQLERDIRGVVEQRKDLLLGDFLSGRGRGPASWRAAYLDNPVLRSVARLVVWDQDGATFTVSGGRPVDAAGAAVGLGEGAIRVAHPAEMAPADVAAWRDYFARTGLKQPFEQVWERVAVTDKSAVKPDRYRGYLFPLSSLEGRDRHGFHLETGGYRDYSCAVSIDGVGLDVRQHDYHAEMGGNRMEIVSFRPYSGITLRRLNHVVAYLDKVCFYPRIASGDMTIMDELDKASFADIIEYINIASENDATELAAALLAYREERFGEYEAVESLLLD